MDNDIRGFDLKVDNFKSQLIAVINEYNLPTSIVYYILKDLTIEVESLFQQSASKQYKQFCEEAQKENAEDNLNENSDESTEDKE